LVPREYPTSGRRSTMSVPMTLRTHQLPTRQTEADLQRAIGAWITTSAFVDIALDHAGDTDLVRIYEGDFFITLDLVRADR
jgi:hypothetical protein